MTIHWLDHDTLERKSIMCAIDLKGDIHTMLLQGKLRWVYSEIEDAKTENERGKHLESVEISEILTTNGESYRLPPQ